MLEAWKNPVERYAMTSSTDAKTQRRYRLSEVARSGETATRTPFFTTDNTGGVVWVVKPGQEVMAHDHSASDDIWICLQGSGVFFPEPCEELEIQAGDVMVSRPGQCHGMRNTGDEDFIFVSVISPAPADFHPIDCDCA